MEFMNPSIYPSEVEQQTPLRNGGWKKVCLSYWESGNFSGGELLDFGR